MFVYAYRGMKTGVGAATKEGVVAATTTPVFFYIQADQNRVSWAPIAARPPGTPDRSKTP